MSQALRKTTDAPPAKDEAREAPVPLHVVPIGLDGFHSESDPPKDPKTPPGNARATWMIALLAALVIAEAVPAALWARDYFSAPAASATPQVPEVAAPPSALAAVPACEPAAPAAVAPSTGTAVNAATGGAAVASTPVQGIAAGVLAVSAPLPLQVFARGRLVGTSEAESIMLPLGSHDLELVNDAAGFRTRRSVTLQSGRPTALRIDPPTGTIHINALPWAEVWVDNQRLGETPIGNLQVPIGTRELVFRHPEFAERRTRVLVTLKEPARISIDLRKQ